VTISECKQVFALLSEYLDQELSPGICEQISAHIQNCPPCVEFVESLRKTTELCRQVQLPEQPAPLPDPVRREILAAWRKLGKDPL
jgi:predicted anti-sigma-YlaC factor YlaD